MNKDCKYLQIQTIDDKGNKAGTCSLQEKAPGRYVLCMDNPTGSGPRCLYATPRTPEDVA